MILNQVPSAHILSFAAVIFFIGLTGLVVRRNLLVILMCIELMLNAVNLTFVTFARMQGSLDGEIATLFIMVVAAAESAVGLGLLIALFRTLRSVDTQNLSVLKE